MPLQSHGYNNTMVFLKFLSRKQIVITLIERKNKLSLKNLPSIFSKKTAILEKKKKENL